MSTANEPRGLTVLDSLKKLRAAETAALRRDHPSGGTGETDLLALLFLVLAAREGRQVPARDLARHLAITPASVTLLIDRLQKTGLVQRHSDPNDRRGTLITATHTSDQDLTALLTSNRPDLLDAAERITATEAATVVAVLDNLTAALDSEPARPLATLKHRAS